MRPQPPRRAALLASPAQPARPVRPRPRPGPAPGGQPREPARRRGPATLPADRTRGPGAPSLLAAWRPRRRPLRPARSPTAPRRAQPPRARARPNRRCRKSREGRARRRGPAPPRPPPPPRRSGTGPDPGPAATEPGSPRGWEEAEELVGPGRRSRGAGTRGRRRARGSLAPAHCPRAEQVSAEADSLPLRSPLMTRPCRAQPAARGPPAASFLVGLRKTS